MIQRLAARVRRVWDEHPVAVVIGIELLILLYMVRPIVWSAYSGDDVVLSQAPMWRELSGQSLWGDIGAANRYWMDAQGRFFPGSIVHTFVLFTAVQTRLVYKIVQLLFIVAAWASVVGFVRAFTRSWSHAAVAGAVALFALQFRYFHDPLLQFAAQQPLLVILLFGALSLICATARARSPRRAAAFGAAAVVVWTAGLLTYETLYPIVIAPILLIVALMEGPRRKAMLWSIAAPTGVLLGVILWVRSSALAPSSDAYTLGLDPVTVVPTFLKQLTGTLPFSYQLLAADPGVPTLNSGWAIGGRWDMLFLACAVLLVVVFRARVRLEPLTRMTRSLLVVIGSLLLVVPSGIIAVTRRWQIGELDWGKPYVSVFLSSIGLVLIVVVLADVLWERVASREPDGGMLEVLHRVVVAGAIVALVVGPLIIADTNVWVVDQYSELRTGREAFIDVIEAGTFDSAQPGSIVVADAASSWFWVNGAFVAWYGGPSGLRFVTPDSPAVEECRSGVPCYRYLAGTDPVLEVLR